MKSDALTLNHLIDNRSDPITRKVLAEYLAERGHKTGRLGVEIGFRLTLPPWPGPCRQPLVGFSFSLGLFHVWCILWNRS